MASMEPSERLALIQENLAEVLNFEIVEIIAEGNNPRIYWGIYRPLD
jgi:tyrosyl-tRNA synthetase